MGFGDPYADETAVDYSGAYETAGNGFDPSGGGCQWDGLPINCTLINFVRLGHPDAYVIDSRRGYEAGTPNPGADTHIWIDKWEDTSQDTPDGVKVIAKNVGYFITIPAAWHSRQGPRTTPTQTPPPPPERRLNESEVNTLRKELADALKNEGAIIPLTKLYVVGVIIVAS